MKKIIIGTLAGITMGILNFIPMFMTKMPCDVCIANFLQWIATGIFYGSVNWKIDSETKGSLVAFLVGIPNFILVGNVNLMALGPIFASTLVFGTVMGWSMENILHLKEE